VSIYLGEEKHMSWLRWLFLGDLGQQLSLSEQYQRLDHLTRQFCAYAATVDQRLGKLQQDNAYLKSYLTAIADLLEQKALISQTEIQQMIIIQEAQDQATQAAAQEWRKNLKLFTLRSEIEIHNNE
jgi:hypothetical protein